MKILLFSLSQIVKMHLIVCEVSDDLAKIIDPNRKKSGVNGSTLQKSQSLDVENDSNLKYM